MNNPLSNIVPHNPIVSHNITFSHKNRENKTTSSIQECQDKSNYTPSLPLPNTCFASMNELKHKVCRKTLSGNLFVCRNFFLCFFYTIYCFIKTFITEQYV